MPVRFDVISHRGIVVVHNFGHLTVATTQSAFAAFTASPACIPGQIHLSDLSAVTSYERDLPGFLQVQADIADKFHGDAPETLLVIYAPTPISMELARFLHNSWSGTGSVIPRIATTEAEALAILGVPETRISDLLASA